MVLRIQLQETGRNPFNHIETISGKEKNGLKRTDFIYKHHDDGDGIVGASTSGTNDKAQEKITTGPNPTQELTEIQKQDKDRLDGNLRNLSKGYLFSLESAWVSGKILGLEEAKIKDLIIAALSEYGLERAYNKELEHIKSLGNNNNNVIGEIGTYLGYKNEKVQADITTSLKEHSKQRLPGRLQSLSSGHIIDLSDAWEQGRILDLEDSTIRNSVIVALSKYGLEKAYNKALGYITSHGDNRYDYVVKEIGSYLNYQAEKIKDDLSKAYADNVEVNYNKALTELANGYLFYKESGIKAGKQLGIPDDQIQEAINQAHKTGLPKAYKLKLSYLEDGTSGKIVKFGFLYELHEHVDLAIDEIKQLGKELGYDEAIIQQNIDSADKNRDKRRNATEEEKELFQ